MDKQFIIVLFPRGAHRMKKLHGPNGRPLRFESRAAAEEYAAVHVDPNEASFSVWEHVPSLAEVARARGFRSYAAMAYADMKEFEGNQP